MATPDDFAFADEHGGSNAAARPRASAAAARSNTAAGAPIAIPSLADVRAAEAREQDDIFDPRAMMRQQQQDEQERRRQQEQQQQQQQAPPAAPPIWPPLLLPHGAAPPPPTLQGTLPASVPTYIEGGGGGGAGGAGGGTAAQQQQQQQQQPPPAAAAAGSAILVSWRQQGNPLLRHVRHVRWRWSDDPSMVGGAAADFVMGSGTTAALFLSLRYHLLHPGYIAGRLRALQQRGPGGGGGGGARGGASGTAAPSLPPPPPPSSSSLSSAPTNTTNNNTPYRLVVLLLLVDAEDPARPLAELSQLALRADATLVCATSDAEAARYLEALQAFERKPASGTLRPASEPDYLGRVASVLSAVRGVNRADSLRLAEAFGSVAEMLRAGGGDLGAVRGVGPTKARRLHEAFSQPFRRTLIVHRGGGGGVGEAGSAAAATRAATGAATAASPRAAAAAAAAGAAAAATAAAQAAPASPLMPLAPLSQAAALQPGLEMLIEEDAEDEEEAENDRLLQMADELGI
jgi:DNA excision repair protein ERCC-1